MTYPSTLCKLLKYHVWESAREGNREEEKLGRIGPGGVQDREKVEKRRTVEFAVTEGTVHSGRMFGRRTQIECEMSITPFALCFIKFRFSC